MTPHSLDEDGGLNAQIIHLQDSCTLCVKKETKKFQRKLTGDEKLMMVTNGGGGGGGQDCDVVLVSFF